MPEPLKTQENQLGHRTKAEKNRRLQAERSLERGKRVNIRRPEWLSPSARILFEVMRRRLRGYELLDNVDAEGLAIYCDAVVNYQEMSKLLLAKDENGKPVADEKMIAAAQAWARLAAQYAEKLGFSPAARARLARQKAARPAPVDDLEALLDDVAEYVNNGTGAMEGREPRVG